MEIAKSRRRRRSRKKGTKKQEKALPLPASRLSAHAGLLAVVLVGNGQLLASFGSTRSQHAAAILRGHSLAEAVLVHSPAIVGLECSFHFLAIYLSFFSLWGAKVLISFQFTKNLRDF